jgi:FAD-linked sulfhydryl oxidase
MQPASQHQQQPWWQQGPCAFVQGLQHNLQRFAASPPWQQHARRGAPPPTAAAAHAVAADGRTVRAGGAPKPVTREELGRATWVFLHTLAAQFPERPTRQQQRDARAVIDALTRIYPCADCAHHFNDIVRADPPTVSSGPEFQAWMCRAHNAVNRSLGKPVFNCELAAARWAPLDCADDDGRSGCDLSVGTDVARRGRR